MLMQKTRENVLQKNRQTPEMIQKGVNRGYGNAIVWGFIINNRNTPLVRINGRMCGKTALMTFTFHV